MAFYPADARRFAGDSWLTSESWLIGGCGRHLAPQLLAQAVDRQRLGLALDVPENPAVARRSPLPLGADRMDRAAMLGRDQAAIGADARLISPRLVDQHLAGPNE